MDSFVKRCARVGMVLGAVALAVACGNGGAAPATSSGSATYATVVSGQTPTVTVSETDGLKFETPSVTVPVGGVVEWKNAGSTPHNVTFSNGGPQSPTMQKGDTFELKFTAAGTYQYACTFHEGAGMTGTVVVQ